MAMFTKTSLEDASKALRALAMLRPELLVPPVIEQFVLSMSAMHEMSSFVRRLFASVANLTEPHRFTSILFCLIRIVPEIVSPTLTFPQSQTYVLPLLIAVLPGIDSNDLEKTSVTLLFLTTMLAGIICVDCSSAIQTRRDLTEVTPATPLDQIE